MLKIRLIFQTELKSDKSSVQILRSEDAGPRDVFSHGNANPMDFAVFLLVHRLFGAELVEPPESDRLVLLQESKLQSVFTELGKRIKKLKYVWQTLNGRSTGPDLYEDLFQKWIKVPNTYSGKHAFFSINEKLLKPQDVELQWKESEEASIEVISDVEHIFSLLEKMKFNPEPLRQLSRRVVAKVSNHELGPFLRRFRETRLEGASPTEISIRLNEKEKVGEILDDDVLKVKQNLEGFEDGTLEGDLVIGTSADIITQVYGAAAIMADWMASSTDKSPIVMTLPTVDGKGINAGTFVSFRMPSSPDSGRGQHCRYLCPRKRLKGTDAAVISSIFQEAPDQANPSFDIGWWNATHDSEPYPFPFSDPHWHPGDELILVMQGEAEVHFRGSGIRQRLRKHDLIHFDAEHPHVVVNVGKLPLRIFTIRFYQLGHEGSRYRLWQRIRENNTECEKAEIELDIDRMKSLLESSPIKSRERLAQWRRTVSDQAEINSSFVHLLRNPSERLSKWPINIQDWDGFRRRLAIMFRHRGGQNDLQLQFHLSFPTVAQSVQHNTPCNVSIEHISALAKMIRIPRVLLDDVFVPPVPSCVVIDNRDGWIKVPSTNDQQQSSAIYEIPCCKLSQSEIDINRLTLPKNGMSPVNDHPGFELILCLSGSVSVNYQEKSHKVLEGQYIHYRSDVEHYVRNDQGEPANLLIIRFLDIDIPEIRSSARQQP